MTAIAQAGSGFERGSAHAARRLAALLPAVLIGYSVLIDPLINLAPVEQYGFGMLALETELKSTMATRIVIPGLFAATLALALVARPAVPFLRRAVTLPLAAFLGLGLASATWSLDFGTSFNLAAYQIILCASLALSVWVADDPGRILKHVFWMFVAMVAVNLAFVMVRPAGPIGHQGIYPFKNTLGGAAACALLFALLHLGRGRLLSRAAALSAVLGAIALLVVSESKTAMAMVAMAPLLAMILYLAMRVLRIRLLVLLAGGGVMAWAAFAIAGALIGFDVGDLMLLAFGDETFTGRTHVWSFVWSHIVEQPIFGHGYRGFWGIGPASPKLHAEIQFITITGSAHSGYLDVLLDLGLVGFALYLLYLLGVVQSSARVGVRSPANSIFYLSVAIFVLGRNAMESVILWSTFFDNLCFVLVGFLACLGGAEAAHSRIRDVRRQASRETHLPAAGAVDGAA